MIVVVIVAIIAYKAYERSRPQAAEDAKKSDEDRKTKINRLTKPLKNNTVSEEILRVEGFVRDKATKKHLSGACVKIKDVTNRPRPDLITTDDGSFEFELKSDEWVMITAELKGYIGGTLLYHIGKDAVIELTKCASITGSVAHNGFPVPKAKITLYSHERRVVSQTESDPKGEFIITNLIPTRKLGGSDKHFYYKPLPTYFYYELGIDHPDYCIAWIRHIQLKENENLNYKIALEKQGTIEGRIYDESFHLLDNVMVSIRASGCNHIENQRNPQVKSTESVIVRGIQTNEGRFSLKLPQGQYHIIADPIGNYTPYESNCITLMIGERKTHDIYLKAGLTITGTVTDDELKLLSDIWVTLTSEEGQLLPSGEGSWTHGQPSMITDYHTKEDGRFVFQGLKGGLYTIRARPTDRDLDHKYKMAELKNITAGTTDLTITLKKKTFEDKDADAEVKLRTLTGKLSDYPFVKVFFINEDRSAKVLSSGGNVKDRVYKDHLPEGTYAILGIDQRLNLYSIIYNQYITKLQNNLISLVLDKKGAQIKGKVSQNDETSFKLTLLLDRQKKLEFTMLIQTDNNGNFEISGLPPGYVKIDFNGGTDSALEFELQPGGVKDLGTINLKK